MKFKITLLLLLYALTSYSEGSPESYILTEPTLHYNFGESEKHFSIGWETSYWYTEDYLAFGADVGFEYEFKSKKLRVYIEHQAGLLLGFSGGLVLQLELKAKPIVGFQTSVWSSYGAGIDFRYTYIGHNNFLSPGFYVCQISIR